MPIVLPKQSELKTVPPKVAKRELLKGYNAENVHNSLFWSIMSIYAIYGCKLPDSVNDLRKLAMNEIKKGILGIKLKDQSFTIITMAIIEHFYKTLNLECIHR